MDRAAVPRPASVAVAFQDGLGERRLVVHPSGTETLELLCLRPDLAAVRSFEFALRERLSRLSHFRHPSFARVRGIERIPDRESTLAVVSEHAPGLRLSDVLSHAAERKVGVDINSALCLVRQLVPAVAILHQHARDVAHGCIAPERIVVAPNARLVLLEHVLGSALEQLRFSPEQYWSELRVALPSVPGPPRFDHRTDVMQIGLVALSLILGRPLTTDEYPGRVAELVASTWAISARGGFEPLPPGLRGWLGRTLQLDPAAAFNSATEARADLDKILGDADRVASPQSLEAFLARYQASEPPKAAPRSRPSTSGRPVSPNQPSVPPGAKGQAPAKAEPAGTASPDAGVHPGTRLFKTVGPDAGDEAQTEGAGKRPTWVRLLIGAALLLALAVLGVLAGRWYFLATPPPTETGVLEVTTDPSGADVFVDGRGRGMTPLTLTLPAGDHLIEVRSMGGETRSLPVTIEAGTQASQYIEIPKVSVLGELQVRTDPPGARVSVDGVSRGVAPMTVTGLEPGEHQVTLESDLGSVTQAVTVEAGSVASLVVPLAAAPKGAPVSGWVSVAAPIELQLYEADRLLGTSRSDRIMVAAGRHEIELVNEALGYRISRVVDVAAGGVARVGVDLPKGTIALNAVPWAEVWIDGERTGETPIGNLELTIGPHSVLFRHPEFGEQHHTATVTLKEVTRLSVDMRKR